MRAWWAWGVLWAVACASSEPAGVGSVRVEEGLRTWVEDVSGTEGVLVVQLRVDDDATWEAPAFRVPGWRLESFGPPVTEEIGAVEVVTWRARFAGAPGMYEVPAFEVGWVRGDDAGFLTSPPLWVDLEVEPPREGELVDLAESVPLERTPWGAILAGASLLALVVGGVGFASRLGRKDPDGAAPPVPPDVRALEAWEEARKNPALDGHDKALEIARILRVYLEEVLRFSATSNTTSEILAHLRGLALLSEGQLPRAKRLLRATDRVKFADAATEEALFDQLTEDLRELVRQTRPRVWEANE